MILKIVFYVLTLISHLVAWVFQSILFTIFLNVIVPESKKNELFSCNKKWEGKYVLLISICAFLVWLGINQIWIYFVGQSIPFILIFFLLVQTLFEYKSQKDEDIKLFLEGYNKSFDSEISTRFRSIVKDVPGLSMEDFKLSEKQIESQYKPTLMMIYNLKGIIFGFLLLIVYLLIFSNSSTSIF